MHEFINRSMDGWIDTYIKNRTINGSFDGWMNDYMIDQQLN